MYAVIMAGGQGTRLWPKSRAKQPKQLHALVDERSLIRATFENISRFTDNRHIIVSTTPDYISEIKKHLPELPDDNFIVEPYPMGTAAACGLVSKILNLRDPESIAGFFPSDHNIKIPVKFAETICYAEGSCEKHPNQIFTIGIKPTRPDTGMGYINMGEKVEGDDNIATYKVKRFVEKPDQETAEKYLASGEYLWNAGMFIWKTSHVMELFEKDMPQTYQVVSEIAANFGKKNYEKILEEKYKQAENTSIDYGIMEKNSDIMVVPADFGWSDIGSWGSLLDVVSEINKGDVVSRGDHIGVDNSNVLVMGHDKLIATVGLENIIVVDTPDVLLICNGKKDQKIKELITRLKDEGKVEYL